MRYQVTMKVTEYRTIDVDANSPEEAEELAYEIDLGDFKEVESRCHWEVDDVEEVEE